MNKTIIQNVKEKVRQKLKHLNILVQNDAI